VQDLDERKLDEYLALIDKKIDAAGGRDWPMSGAPHPWSSLTDVERITLTAYFFALDVSNGEFEKYFLERGDSWRETLHAIRTVGATRLAELFEEALGAFPGESHRATQRLDTTNSWQRGRLAATVCFGDSLESISNFRRPLRNIAFTSD
jgi:hypothetical protein